MEQPSNQSYRNQDIGVASPPLKRDFLPLLESNVQTGLLRGKLAETPILVRFGLSICVLVAIAMYGQQIGTGVVPTATAMVFSAAALSSIAGFAFAAVCGAMLFH